MVSRRLMPCVVSFLLFVGSTDLAAQRPQPIGIQNSRDSTAAEAHTPPDYACVARRSVIVGANALVGMGIGRLVYELTGGLLASDHGRIYRRERHHWEVGGAIFGAGFSALVLGVVTCDELSAQYGTVRRPVHSGFH